MLSKFNKTEIIYIVIIVLLLLTIVGMRMMPSQTPEAIVYNTIEAPEDALVGLAAADGEALEDMVQETDEASEEDASVVVVPKATHKPTTSSKKARATPKPSKQPAKITAGESKININTASVTELARLPGVGEATAVKIIEYRESRGPFGSIKEIMKVSGIGDKKFADMEQFITVGDEE